MNTNALRHVALVIRTKGLCELTFFDEINTHKGTFCQKQCLLSTGSNFDCDFCSVEKRAREFLKTASAKERTVILKELI